MWKEPDPDPGGEPPESSSKFSRQLSDLKDENEQQKVLIAQLKEMLRKDQSNVSQEKIDEYVNTLKKMTAKKSRVKKGESSSTEKHITIETGKTGKLNLLKQQLEQNKARLAERGKNQKGMEEMVTQLQADLNDSQQLISSGPMMLIEPKTLEYSKSTSPEDLYNILIMKEQKITEFMTRTQKQEAKILDLQENLKEKDSVIDARTKAITLMTDSLSKKGKSTLDALDERTEQMRKMQEDFVNYENDMKARQVKLLEDLKAKNLEIHELKETNENLLKECQGKEESGKQNLEILVKDLELQLETSKKENVAHLGKISELEHQLQESLEDINRLKNIGTSVGKPTTNDDEINKLKKQLEESNKNMIKLKAQSKSKIKDLTKKLEAFKKMSDVNALVADLQNENTKLSEKVAELEEEKGNLQLNMVESSDSIKDTALVEENKQLQAKISQNMDELNEKDKVISLLEVDIIVLKEEISTLNTQISNLSHLENAQVTSEMKSIQIEEQLDQLETENAKLKAEIENLQKQNKELSDKIDSITKEKQEISTKLDNYIQENMDLIDKLEKLSAEKVSSAESIEIVEGLTQQEKNELAAYQKTLDVNLGEPVKIVEDPDDTEAPPELNESVHQLNEDSADLLRKIEMFNAERKEVMFRMEALKEENNNLSLKVQEIENNRDILADTYEQLQTEKEEIVKEKESLEEKLRVLESGLENKTTVLENPDVSSQLNALQAKYEKLLEENEALTATIKNFDAKIHEKHELESSLKEYRNKVDVLEEKLQNSVQEITNYETIIEENKNELIGSANTINNLETKLNDREAEIKELNTLINDLNNVVNNLQAENEKIGNFEVMESKFEELKTALNTQIEQAQDYAEEIEHNRDVITDLNGKLQDMNRKILDTEHEIDAKEIEMEKLKQELFNRDDMIRSLQLQIEERDEKLKLVTLEMKDKYLALQKQLDGNNGSLEQQIEDLHAKNKEQLEKMKKIAANLKKKNQAYQELDGKYQAEKEKWETELKEKETLISKVKDLKEEVDQKTLKLEECEARIRELTEIVQNLEQDLENSVIEMRRKQENLHEVSLKQELSTSLHEQFDEEHSTNASTNDGKIKELELIIETNESELSHYKERLQKLEEELEKSLEDREQMEIKLASSEKQLSLVLANMEEKAMREEELGQKLEQVNANDELLVKKLEESNAEVNELLQKTKEQEELITKLKVKLKKAHEKVQQLKNSQQALEELEATNNELKKQLAHLESVLKHTQEENEELQRRNQSEYEKIENDYQIQLEELVRIRNELMIECEKLKEDLKTYKDREDEILEEMAELKLKTEETDRLSTEVEELSKKLAEESTSKNTTLKEIEVLNDTLQSYKFEIQELNQQIIQKTAKEAVEEIVELAADKIVSMNTKETQTEFQDKEIPISKVEDAPPTQDVMPTFHWPGPSEAVIEQPFVQSQTSAAVATSHPAFLSDIESQILSPDDVTDAANNKQALQQIEFEKVHPSFGVQTQPVIEVVKPKQAYLTFQPGTEAFGENDDGWGWGPEESKLEEEHQNLASSTSQVQNLKAQLAQANEKVLVLQMERENHLEEIKQLQVKSGKLIKKCKELKTRNDQLMAQKGGKKSTDEFFDLNDAIQDELKSQIEQLEKRIKEITTELDKEKSEKKSILNRVDVLTAANERMVEMKEIQDSEVLRWKRKYEETEEKLQQCDWESDGFRERPPSKQPEEDSQTIEELQRTIKELSLDNEELQSLLNEQRDLRIQAEKSKALDGPTIPPELENKIRVLEHELTVRNGEIQAVLAEKSNMIDSLQASLSQKENVVSSLEEELLETSQKLEESNIMLKNLQTSCHLIKSEFEEKVRAYESLKHSFDQLNSVGDTLREMKKCLDELKEEKMMLETTLSEKDNQLRDVYTQINSDSSRSSDIEELKLELQESEQQRNQLQALVNDSETKFHQLMFDLDLVSSKLLRAEQSKAQLEDVINQKESELENLKSSYDSWGSKYKEEEAQDDTKAQLEALITEKDDALNQYKAAYDQIMALNDSLTKQNEILGHDMDDLKRKISVLQEENKNLQETLNQLELEKSRSVQVLEKTEEEIKQKSSSEENRLLEELTALKAQKQEVDAELEGLRFTLDERQREFEVVIADLEAKWAAQVDERGNTVAESWKYHLTMVETEFAAVQEKLKTEISELEEKCNLLVNENNELRKNVDAEIRNEVDKISALQHQINEKQQAINDLTLLLNQEQHESNLLKEKLANMGDVTEKEKEMKRLKFVLETTQQQFEEKREVLEEIVKVLENYSPNPITLQKEDILSNFSRQLMKNSEYEQEIQQLRIQIDDFRNTVNLVKEAEIEITNLKETIENLQQQLKEKEQEINKLALDVGNLQSFQNVAQDKDGEIFRLNELVSNLQEQLNSVFEKDAEISNLKQSVDDLQGQLARLSQKDQEIVVLQQTIEDYKTQISQLHQNYSMLQEEKTSMAYYVEDSKRQLEETLQSHTSLQNTIDQQNQEIITLNQHLQQYENYRNDSNQVVEQLHNEIAQLKEDCGVSQKSLAETQQQLFTAMQELSDKTNALDNVTQQLNTTLQNSEILENELLRLRQTLEHKEREFSDSVETLKKSRFTEVETHYEEALGAKELDLEKATAQLQEALQLNSLLSENFGTETRIRTELELRNEELEQKMLRSEEKLTEQLKLMEEEEKQLEEMRGIIEEQVVKIEELKKELFEKSNYYDSLIAEMDIGKKNVVQQQAVQRAESSASTSKSQHDADISDPVNRAELDLALYMLHQRDVRCEELTVELTQLLEERDTLQLRLSNAIREKEELRRKHGGPTEAAAPPVNPSQDPSTPTRSRSSQIFLAASGAELATEASEVLAGEQSLASKLSELKIVGYKNDKTFVDEQQLRRLQQMSIMEQHIKEAAKLPPEAAARLVDASYTLSRDVQSPSKVILNWLWGRSTPRQNDI